jgi:hypothetical protein
VVWITLPAENKRASFSAFPHVCPEPVLAKRSRLYMRMTQQRGCWGAVPEHGQHRFVPNEQLPGLRNTPLFFEFSLCLSRACLGKMMHFIYKWRKKWLFCTGSLIPRSMPLLRSTISPAIVDNDNMMHALV